MVLCKHTKNSGNNGHQYNPHDSAKPRPHIRWQLSYDAAPTFKFKSPNTGPSLAAVAALAIVFYSPQQPFNFFRTLILALFIPKNTTLGTPRCLNRIKNEERKNSIITSFKNRLHSQLAHFYLTIFCRLWVGISEGRTASLNIRVIRSIINI